MVQVSWMSPLWLRKPTEPVRAMPEAKVAFTPEGGTITPRQLGPMIRIPALRAFSSNCFSSSLPSSPASLNPAEITTAALMPTCPHSSIRPGMNFEGVTRTARSTSAGMSFTEAYALMPRRSAVSDSRGIPRRRTGS